MGWNASSSFHHRRFIIDGGTMQRGGVVRQGRDLGGDGDEEVIAKFSAEGGGRFRPNAEILFQEGRGIAQHNSNSVLGVEM